ncbi:hypothetical protein NG900_20590 [Ralstonia sp. 21MJYT02-11]|uniref:Uncharacterized protein n=1 Tax=Ralstonia soli TaxID=2953896 RepID=A0ABT1AQD2_9RALS|nr:hypothetical protein [Ralstonia soli]
MARPPFGREHLLFVIAGMIDCAGSLSTILFRQCLRHLQWWLSDRPGGAATARAAVVGAPARGHHLAGRPEVWIPRKGA